MPSRNRVKIFIEDGHYHAYNRGVNKQAIFNDDSDYAVFLNLFKRYLDDKPHQDNKAREYPWLHDKVQLMAYCLMPNHFHLLLMQKERDSMTKLLQMVCTSYTTYFNKKYERIGPLFQGNYKASLISDDAYLIQVGRYIHLNPKEYIAWRYSSYKYFVGLAKASWVQPGLALTVTRGQPYKAFLAEFSEDDLDQLKPELADY